MNCSKKIIITGASGLIGKEALEPLLKSGFEVYAITSKIFSKNTKINWIKCDIFDYQKIEEIFQTIKPSYLLHFAWTTEIGYLHLAINNNFVDASINLLKEFAKNGGKRAVFAGTCFEYELGKNTPIKETDKIEPNTLYAECKNRLNILASNFASNNNISFGWGRIFYVYGHNEHNHRLVGNLIHSIKNNTEFIIKTPYLERDYMYTKDIAKAFVNFLESKVEGNVNICSGNPIRIIDLSREFLNQANAENLLKIEETQIAQPQTIVGDNFRLKNEILFEPSYSIKEAVNNILKN